MREQEEFLQPYEDVSSKEYYDMTDQKEGWLGDKEDELPRVIKINKVNIHVLPILVCLLGNVAIHVVLDYGATSILITLQMA